jgi:mannose-6-phosphate isomerase-like protein (cupin superfamily)
MRTALLLSFMVSTPAVFAQTPAPAVPPRPTPAPAPARRAQPAAARTGMTIAVTDPRGTALSGVQVEVLGSSDRSGATDANGQISFTGMMAGTYRLRFTSDTVIAFEREIAIRAGQTADVDITLNPAPARREPPAPAPVTPVVAPPPPVGPAGKPQIVSIVSLVEHELIGNSQARLETLVACSGNTRTTLVQLNQNQPDRLHETAEVTYYVVAGEGAVRVNDRETALAASSFVSLPRGTLHSLIRRGRRPFILLATLSGTPCEEAR